MHGVYTKGDRWEIFNAPITASWTLKKIFGVKDLLLTWIGKDKYSIKKTYIARVEPHLRFRWINVIWNRFSIPKTRFIYWMAVIQKLKTRDKLKLIRVVDNDLCPLCGIHSKSNAHLFFECIFSQRCLQEVRRWSSLKFKPIAHMEFRKPKGNTMQRNTLCAIYTSTVYHIWRSRNDAVRNGFVRSPSYISAMV